MKSEQQLNNKSIDFGNFSIEKIRKKRKVTWTDVSMLYHVVAKVLMLFVIPMFVYMPTVYILIQYYELNFANNAQCEIKILNRLMANDILEN